MPNLPSARKKPGHRVRRDPPFSSVEPKSANKHTPSTPISDGRPGPTEFAGYFIHRAGIIRTHNTRLREILKDCLPDPKDWDHRLIW